MLQTSCGAERVNVTLHVVEDQDHYDFIQENSYGIQQCTLMIQYLYIVVSKRIVLI